MSDGLQLSMHTEIEETIDSGTHGDTSRIVMGCSECTEHLALYILYLLSLIVIFLLRLPEEPVHSVADAWSDIDIFHQCEVRKTDREVMGHTVLELIPETWLVELRCLEVDSVLKRCVITKRELLIPLLLTYSVLLLEWVKL